MAENEARCEICGEPMPRGEELFKYHGYSGPCPAPPKPKRDREAVRVLEEALIKVVVLAADVRAMLAALRADGEGGAVCGVIGEPEAGRKVCELPAGHDGYHQQGTVRWLGYHPRAEGEGGAK